jgi:hypothetical protein
MTPNELERRLAAAATDPAERPAFARALLESEVFVLGTLDRPTVGGAAQPGTAMKLVTWTDHGGPTTPFFTSEATLQPALASRPESDPRFLRMKSRDLFAMTKGQRLVLNPYGANGKVYEPDEVAALLAGNEPGLTTQVLQAERQVRVGAAAHVPPQLPEVLARYLVQRPIVHAAHLGWIAHPDGHEGYLMVVVADDRDAAMLGFGTLQIGEVTGGPALDVIVVPPGGQDQHMLSAVPAFYVRQAQPDLPEANRRRRFGGRS